VSARVNYRIFRVVVGSIGIPWQAFVKGKEEYFHARKSEMLHGGPHIRCDRAKILRNDGKIREHVREPAEEIHARSIHPLAVDGDGFGCRHFPVGH